VGTATLWSLMAMCSHVCARTYRTYLIGLGMAYVVCVLDVHRGAADAIAGPQVSEAHVPRLKLDRVGALGPNPRLQRCARAWAMVSALSGMCLPNMSSFVRNPARAHWWLRARTVASSAVDTGTNMWFCR
jgi:hypothetical protein